jgi:hypothetical protein
MSDLDNQDDNEFVNSHTVSMTNGTFFTIRFEKQEGREVVDLFQVFDEDNEIYLMSMSKEHIVEVIYQLESMLND